MKGARVNNDIAEQAAGRDGATAHGRRGVLGSSSSRPHLGVGERTTVAPASAGATVRFWAKPAKT